MHFITKFYGRPKNSAAPKIKSKHKARPGRGRCRISDYSSVFKRLKAFAREEAV